MDPRTWTLALNSLLLAGAVCAISVPMGSLLAWLLVRTDLPGRRIGLALLGLMLFVPLYLQAAAWQAGFGVQGWMTLNFGVEAWMEGWAGAIWVHAAAAVPWVVLIVGAGLLLVEPELEEQALLDGSARQVFWHVSLRGALPAVGIATLWVAIVTAVEIAVTDLFVVRTYAEEVYTRLRVGPQLGDGPLSLTPGVVLTVASIAAGLLLCAKLLPAGRPITLCAGRTFRLGPWRATAAIIAALLLLLLVGVPLASLCYKAGVLVTQTETGRLRSWSAGKCLSMIVAAPWQHRRELGWSLGIGTLSATAAVVAATALAWATRTVKRPRTAVRGMVLILIALCLAVPGPVLGLAIIRLLNRPEIPPLVWLYDNSILAPWLALLIRSLPPATLVMWHALRTVPQETLDAAAVDGAGPIRQLCFVALPCRLTALALAWVVAFAVSLGDLAASILVAPPGLTTLSIQVFDLLHSGVEDRVAGLSLAMIAVFAAAAAVAAGSHGIGARGRGSRLGYNGYRGHNQAATVGRAPVAEFARIPRFQKLCSFRYPIVATNGRGLMRRSMPNTLRVLGLSLVLSILPFAPAAALDHVTLEREGNEIRVSGRVLVEAVDGGLLFQERDGVIWAITPEQLVNHTRDAAPFEPFSREEMSQRMLQKLPAGFDVHPTAHYLIFYDTSRAYAHWCGSLFEQLHMAFTNYWSRKGFVLAEPEFPLVAIVFAGQDAYSKFSQPELGGAAGAIIGYFSMRSNRMTMYDLTGIETLLRFRNQRSTTLQINQILARPEAAQQVSTIVHEATHQIAFNCGLHNRYSDCPVWFSEGIAMFFETPNLRSSRGWRGIGGVNRARLVQFHQYMRRRPANSLEALLRDDKRLKDTELALDAYAEAWALTYFLIRYREKDYVEYLQMLSEKQPLLQDGRDGRLKQFKAAFGDDLRKLDDQFIRYMMRVR